MKPLSIEEITALRHKLFKVFLTQSFKTVKKTDDALKACKLADTALKALGDNDWKSGPQTLCENADRLKIAEPDLIRAYAVG